MDGSAAVSSPPLVGKVDPGLFTKELETELLAGTISRGGPQPEGFADGHAAGFDAGGRAAPRGHGRRAHLEGAGRRGQPDGGLPPLPPGATIATSSLRRQRQLLWHRPDLRVCEVRGNVGTRLRKLARTRRLDGPGPRAGGPGTPRPRRAALRAGFLETADGVRFAAAALGPAVMLPAVGQGAIGLQARADDAETLRVLAAVNHAPTWAAVTAERALLSLLGGGCQLPLGVLTTTILEERGQLRLQAVLFGADGGARRRPRFGEGYGPLDDPAGGGATLRQVA